MILAKMMRGVLCLCLVSWAAAGLANYTGFMSSCPMNVPTCPDGDDIVRPDPNNPRVFEDLTIPEINAIKNYMFSSSGIPLVEVDDAELTDPFILAMELIPPRKDLVVQHLDEKGANPQREARVVVMRGDLAEPIIEEYKVGVLPNPTSHVPYYVPNWKYPIPFSARIYHSLPQMKTLRIWAYEQLEPINPILRQSSGYEFKHPDTDCQEPHSNCLSTSYGVAAHIEPGFHKAWLYLSRVLEGGYLYPVGFQFLVDMSKPDKNDWTVDRIWYQGEYFNSIQEMLDAFNSGALNPKVVEEPAGAYTRELVSSLNFRGNPMPAEPRGGPKLYYPDGRRFKVNGHHIEWMGWDYDFAMKMTQGILLQDIRFQGQRIAYEVSLQEIAVHYSGESPAPKSTVYYDTLALLGTRISKLFRGIDCPDNAAFFDIPMYMNGYAHIFPSAVCVFEHDRGVPARRHYATSYDGTYNWAQGMRDIVLITRSIFSISNYDYIIDFMLHQAGEIEVKASLSGYTVNNYFTGNEGDRYGHQTQKDSTGNLHHHTIHFKADLDVSGRFNRFHSLDISVEEQDEPGHPGETMLNRVVTRSDKVTEKEALVKYDFDHAGYFVQYTESSRNRLGYQKGYRIAPAHMSKLLLPDDYMGYRSRAWMKYQVAITKHHDFEMRSSSMYHTMEPFDPPFSFDDYVKDDESIVDQDLVAWVTVGVHHIPHSEDVPVVINPPVQLTFFLLPYNYFDQDPSMASRDNIRVSPGSNGEDEYEYAGVEGTACCVPRLVDGNGNDLNC